jgi:arginine repressor
MRTQTTTANARIEPRNTMRRMVRTLSGGVMAATMLAWLPTAAAEAQPSTEQSAPAKPASTAGPVEHALEGTVENVDSAAKTIGVKTADGTVAVIKVTDHTTVSGAKAGAKYTDLAAERGSHVVVHYTEEGSVKTAHGIRDFGKGTKKATEGTVVAVDKAGKTVTVKTAQGTDEVFHVSEHATVETGKGVAKETAKGSRVTVYYTEEAGKKIAHFFKM